MEKSNLVVLLGVLAAAMACSRNGDASSELLAQKAACEINYSVLPHKKAIEKLGQERLAAAWSVRSSFDDEQRFIESFHYITDDIFAVFGIQDVNNEVGINTVFGGYLGFTSPSLNIKFDLSDEVTRQKLSKAAAAIGYVFVQDSVIVQCTPENGDVNLVPSFEVTEEGPVDALNKGSIKSIYGMMIGESGGDLKQGFSYYPHEDRFSVLGFSENGDRDREIIRRVSDQISVLSGEAHSLTVAERFRWVEFPANDWTKFPNGGAYAQNSWTGAERQQLDLIQIEFFSQLDKTLKLTE